MLGASSRGETIVLRRIRKLPPLAEHDARRIANAWFKWGGDKAEKLWQQLVTKRKIKKYEAIIFAEYIREFYGDLQQKETA